MGAGAICPTPSRQGILRELRRKGNMSSLQDVTKALLLGKI
jgi:hypothetical protein